jgi:hypothetical protein
MITLNKKLPIQPVFDHPKQRHRVVGAEKIYQNISHQKQRWPFIFRFVGPFYQVLFLRVCPEYRKILKFLFLPLVIQIRQL